MRQNKNLERHVDSQSARGSGDFEDHSAASPPALQVTFL